MNLISNYYRQILNFLHYLLFGLFAYASFSKLSDFDVFVNNLDKSPFFTGLNTSLLAGLLIFGELIIMIFIFFEKTSQLGYFLSFLLFLLFTGYILLIFKFSPYIPCSCGGLIDKLSWGQHIYFNILFMLISIVLFFCADKFQNDGATTKKKMV
ncbi:MauE/DoxX family redox-associated membrane protein [Sphingobacterium siyangense]|uniref:MauE/DoxX family redox-associated membrane protein n=1 Tax=Sphingobacterium siyangense TaxID=459529 RepID=UPI00391C3156